MGSGFTPAHSNKKEDSYLFLDLVAYATIPFLKRIRASTLLNPKIKETIGIIPYSIIERATGRYALD